jgi:3-oxoacyl-[acyl-carrier protein] reductase
MAHRGPAGVAGRRVVVVATEPARRALADGLRRERLAVAVVPPGDDYDGGLDAAAEAIGGVDAVVWAETAPGLATPALLTDVDEARWHELVAGSLRRYVAFLQAAERQLRGGGRLVVMVPTLGLDGAGSSVAWASVAEGQRSLAKSVARVWGTNGVTVNCVAVPARLLAGVADDLGRPDLQQPALPDPDLGNDATGVVAALCGEAMSAVTGATIAVDGGRWMPA